MRLLSLYSGIGGLDLAAHWAGIDTVAFCESDAFCRQILSRHWPEVPIFESDELVTASALRERGIDPASIDIVAGGPPCQPFSIAGKQLGTNDPRHRWPQMARIVSEVRPAWCVLENVPHLAGLALDAVLDDLDHFGYTSRTFVVPAGAVGSPQGRARVFVVAVADADQDGREQRRPTHDDDGSDALRNESDGRHSVGSFGVGMADTDGAGQREQRGSEPVEPEQRSAQRGGDAGVEFAAAGGPQKGHGRTEETIRRPAGRGRERTPESGLGGVASRIAARLDSTGWPFPMLMDADGNRFAGPQFDYEPPRTTTVRELRRKRVAALGNAVVPQQMLPLFAAIVEASR